MSDNELLSDDELTRFTGFCRAAEREAWLTDHNVPFRKEGKRFIVSRFHMREWIAGREVVFSSGPNWGAMGA
jgi:hypothetical protein